MSMKVLTKITARGCVCAACMCVSASHLEVLYSRGLFSSVTEDGALAVVSTAVFQDVIKGLEVWRNKKKHTHTL